MLKKKWLSKNNEKGSASIEFLGVLPFYFLFFLLLWQAVASGYAVFVTRAAVNDAAKVYALSEQELEARQKAKDYIGNTSLLKYVDLQIVPGTNGTFEAKITVQHGLTFIPETWRERASITMEQKATSRVLN